MTIASALKELGYAAGQFGKNHLGDCDEILPTNHSFDEFFGNLYHFNAEEEPENRNYPVDPAFREEFGPRGVIRASADGEIDDTGPLTRKRMETIDDEIAATAIDFMQRQVDPGTPFLTWFNTTRMHFRTHVREELRTHVREEHRSEPGLRADLASARLARRDGHRRQHDRGLRDRQRPPSKLMAGHRNDAVSQRGEHQLGRRLSRPGDGPAISSPERSRPACSRTLTGSRRCSPRPATPTSRRRTPTGSAEK